MTDQQEHKDGILKGVDDGIRPIVEILIDNGIETFESCQGGEGHAFPEPTVRFFGQRGAGMHAIGIALDFDLKVTNLRRVWPILEDEPTGPNWEMTFVL